MVALGQLATLLSTWPLFGAREAPPLLPLPGLAGLAAVPGLTLLLVVASLVLLVGRPAVGGAFHLAAVLVACALDTTRFVPPVVSLAILGLGVSRPALLPIARAHLASLWLWAGLHKLLSPAYFAVLVPALASDLPEGLRAPAGVLVALVELALGAAALVPRLHRGVGAAAALWHALTALVLVALGPNHGVVAWNVTLAVLAAPVLAPAPGERSWLAHAVLLALPALSYVLPIHPTLAHHLYSGATPITLTCGQDGCTTDAELRAGLAAFGVPIPPSIGTLERYFLATCAPGDRWLARSRLPGPGYGEVLAEAECSPLTPVRGATVGRARATTARPNGGGQPERPDVVGWLARHPGWYSFVMERLYRYVGPEEIAERGGERGARVSSATDLSAAVARHGGVLTYVVDAAGVLRVADRRSEHVACAGGAVRAAGELWVEGGRVAATNQSTGFCPEPSSVGAFAAALARAGIAAPAGFAPAFDFRRCPACRALELVKDELVCSACGVALPSAWNVDVARAERTSVTVGAHRYVVDVVRAAASGDQDRFTLVPHRDGVFVALSDGAGGSGHGREAAEAVVALAPSSDPVALGAGIVGIDDALAGTHGGQATALAFFLGPEGLAGVAVGDTELWWRGERGWHDGTASVIRKPLVGSGAATVGELRAPPPEVVVAATDGLWKYAAPFATLQSVDAHPDDPFRVLDPLWLASGGLPDDVTVVIARRLP